MDKDINILFQHAMRPIMLVEAKIHGEFLTQVEYEQNVARIGGITSARRRLERQLKLLNAHK